MSASPARPDYTFSLRTILAALTLGTVLITAGVVHFSWWVTAKSGVNQAVAQTDRHIAARVSEEVGSLFGDARATVRALHTVLTQRVVAATDPVRREFLFLAHLQAHRHLTWISFGFPDGSLFGARRLETQEIQMVEITPQDGAESVLRIDHYIPEDDDIRFQRRELLTTPTKGIELPWYALAEDAGLDASINWTDIHDLPVDKHPGLSAALPLHIFEEFIGVISVSVSLEALDTKLRGVRAGESGLVFIIDRSGRVVSSPTGMRSGPLELMTVRDALMHQDKPLSELNSAVQRLMPIGESGDNYYVGIAPLPEEDWLVVTVIPESDFTSMIDDTTRNLAFILMALVAIIGIGAIAVSRRIIGRPLSALAAQMRDIASFQLSQIGEVPSNIREVRALSLATVQMARGLRGVVRFVPVNLVQSLVNDGTASHPQRRTATLLYLDIAGFTALGESETPESLVALLNDFFTLIDEIIGHHGGSVMQFQGDAILAAFNVPLDNPAHASNAMDAALEIVSAVDTRLFGDGQRLTVRIGVNTGSVLAATVGSEHRADYTIHGDAVNLAARLEQLNKEHGSRVMVSADTIKAAGRHGEGEPIGEVSLRGKQQAVTVYRLA
jgi:adenylate cyclase